MNVCSPVPQPYSLTLLEARIAAGLTQHQLAVRSGIPAADIARMELSLEPRAGSAADMLFRLAAALNRDPFALMARMLHSDIQAWRALLVAVAADEAACTGAPRIVGVKARIRGRRVPIRKVRVHHV